MPLTVLTDADVRKVLDTLDKDDIQMMHKALADALHNYSTATDDGSGCCAANQPSRIAIKRKDGGATLFMPATSDDAMGVKIVTLAESSTGADVNSLASSTRSLSLITSGSSSSPGQSRSSSPGPIPRSGTPVSAHPSRASTFGSHHNSSFSGASTATSTTHATSASMSTDATTRSSTTDDAKPDTITSSGVPIFNPRHAVDLAPPSATSPTGSITLLSRSGQPRAFINAATFTAFRTALASMLLFRIRHNVHTLTVFGAGLQAYWHIHLALLMRGEEIHHLNVINRSFPRAQRMMITLAKHQAIGFGEKMRPSILTPEYGEYTRLLKEHVRNADAIICCTPSTEPLFPPSYLTNPEGRRKARYVAAVGSYKPHMQELHADVLRRAVAPHSHTGRHNHRHATDGGAIVVDSIEGALREAGEVINAGIGAHGVVELGEIVMLKRSHWAEKAEREQQERERQAAFAAATGSASELPSPVEEGKGQQQQHHHGIGHGIGHLFHHHRNESQEKKELEQLNDGDGGLKHWLARGNVIYKSVGIGLMDVVVGMEIVRLAEQRGIGTFLKDF